MGSYRSDDLLPEGNVAALALRYIRKKGSPGMKRYIEVVEYGENGGELGVVHRVDVSDKSERAAEKVMDGLERNMDHRRFFTRFNPSFQVAVRK
jgi:hypothetical protein